MFSLGGKATFVDESVMPEVISVSDLLSLLHAQEQLLGRKMSGEEMRRYEIRAEEISEVLRRLTHYH